MGEGKSFIFVVNPGSASRKYALFLNGRKNADIHFELVDNKVVGNLYYQGKHYGTIYNDGNLENASHRVLPLLKKYRVMADNDKIAAIGIRIVAPSRRFTKDEFITDDSVRALTELRQETPLHIKTALREINQLRTRFVKVPIIGVSDSKFHATRPDRSRYYGIDIKLSEEYGIERYGYHGISVESVVNRLEKQEILLPKTIVCHLGSGSSVTAVQNGKSIDNTMGYSPLEGLMMSTRSGTLDVSAAVVLKEKLGLTDIGLEQYLDKQAGLLGVSGTSDDIRQLVESERKGDVRAKLALDIFVYRIQQAIGQMAASLDGASCLVFTGTVGERSHLIRKRVVEDLSYLGFEIDEKVNIDTYEPEKIANIANDSSKPILVIATDESAEIAKRVQNNIRK